LRGGLVVRVLRYEPTGEGVMQDRLAQALRALQLGVEVGFEVVNDGELILDCVDDGFLFGTRRERDAVFAKVFKMDVS
jgi:hypothetical protein